MPIVLFRTMEADKGLGSVGRGTIELPFAANPRALTVGRPSVLLPHKGGGAMRSSSRKSSNRLLNSLSTADFGLLGPNLEPLDLALRQVLETPNKRIDDVYFIDSGFASVVAIQAK